MKLMLRSHLSVQELRAIFIVSSILKSIID